MENVAYGFLSILLPSVTTLPIPIPKSHNKPNLPPVCITPYAFPDQRSRKLRRFSECVYIVTFIYSNYTPFRLIFQSSFSLDDDDDDEARNRRKKILRHVQWYWYSVYAKQAQKKRSQMTKRKGKSSVEKNGKSTQEKSIKLCV